MPYFFKMVPQQGLPSGGNLLSSFCSFLFLLALPPRPCIPQQKPSPAESWVVSVLQPQHKWRSSHLEDETIPLTRDMPCGPMVEALTHPVSPGWRLTAGTRSEAG